MTIHQRSTPANWAWLTGGRGWLQATIDIASSPARTVKRRLLRGRRRGRRFPPERVEHVVCRLVGLVGQRLGEPFLVVGLDAFDRGDDLRLRCRVLYLLDLGAELVVLVELLLLVLGHARRARRGLFSRAGLGRLRPG